ncbi:MAG TPA: PRC-barrel domain-containing protein [Streptosporangiaceae bacterium]|nr:PRC-barrel domain-containing protein [Streptosporangiaceae bacterium]
MADTPFEIGASVRSTDAACGHVIRVIVDPIGRTVTHLVVGPRHEYGHHIDRLVPVDLVQVTADGIELSCTKADFDKLDPAEETHFVASSEQAEYAPEHVWGWPWYAMSAQGMRGDWTEGQGWDRGGSHGPQRRTVTYDSVPLGEVQVRRGEHVQATDGEIGLVEGLVIDPDDHQVTHVLLQEGHLWGRKQVAIPIKAVTGVDAGIRLSLSRRQVEDLPPVDIDRPASPAP